MQMDDVTHDDHGSQIDLEGYSACVNTWCGKIVLREVAEKTRGYCTDCFRGPLGTRITEVEIISRGQRMPLSLRAKPWPAKKHKGDRDRQRAQEKAKLRAMRRLRAVFPDIYDVFLAEERARVGLNPWPTEMAVRGGPDIDGSKTMDFAEVYHRLAQHGVDVDGAAKQQANEDDPAG
jgi:hypothetical protein